MTGAKINTSNVGHPSGVNYRHKLLKYISIVAIVTLLPFAINHAIQGRLPLSLGLFFIVSIFLFTLWNIIRHHRDYPLIILLGLVPMMIVLLIMSMQVQGLIGIFWSYPAMVLFYFMLPERMAWVANALLLAVLIPVVWFMFEFTIVARAIMTLLLISACSAIFIRVITEQQDRLKDLATTDALTGLKNRMLLRETLERAVAQNERTDIPMTLVTMDLDYFKQINDRLGHDVGDVVLVETAEMLKKRCREVDSVFRTGGEEFLILLYSTTEQDAEAVAEDLRYAVASMIVVPGYPITVSIGVAELEKGEGWRRWMKRGDKKLYLAKSGGRNQVIV